MLEQRTSAFIIQLPAIIKAGTAKDGRRLVEVGASTQETDSEGDVILQKALLDAADDFVKSGHIDLNHYSELGHRMGIPNPSSYIIGRPIEVKDYGKGQTGVVSEIMRSSDGKSDPVKNRYDEFWESLQTKPPMKWSASIYGFPKAGMIDDCTAGQCDHGAKRYLVRGIDWRSLAMTTNPINRSMTKFATVVTAKAFVGMLKAGPGSPLIPVTTVGLSGETFPPVIPPQPDHDPPFFPHETPPAGYIASEDNMSMAPAGRAMNVPHNMDSLVGQYHNHLKRDECPLSGGMNSVIGFKAHFMGCCGAAPEQADLLAHALMYHILLEKKRGQ